MSMYLFCREIGLRRKVSLLATGILLFSPCFLILSSTYLPYCGSLAMCLMFAALFARGLRRDSFIILWLAGVIFGIAFFARPYDALLFAVVWGGFYPAWKSQPRKIMGQLVKCAMGFLPVLAVVMLFNIQTTGAPFVFPFQQDDLDTFGFGVKRVFPGSNVGVIYFDFFAALNTTIASLCQVALWAGGSVLFTAVALIYLTQKTLRRRDIALCAIVIIYALGYFVFWGPYNMLSWGALHYLGPNYYVPCLIPLSIFSARGFYVLTRWVKKRDLHIFCFLAALLTIVVLTQALQTNLLFTKKFASINKPIQDREKIVDRNDLIFVTPIYGDFMLHPFRTLSNDGTENGKVIYAVNRGMDNFSLLDAYPTRSFFRFDSYGVYDDSPYNIPITKLVPFKLVNFTEKNILLRITPPHNVKWLRVCVIGSPNKSQCVEGKSLSAKGRHDLEVKISNQGISFANTSSLSPSVGSLAFKRGAFIAGRYVTVRVESFDKIPSKTLRANIPVFSSEYRYYIRPYAGGLQSIEPPEQWSQNKWSRNWYRSNNVWVRVH